MKHPRRIQAFALACALLAAGGVAAHLWATPEARAEAQEDCPTPPPVDPAYFDTKPGKPWARVQDYMANAEISFDYGTSTRLNVRLCAEDEGSCQPFVAQIQSEKSNHCLTRESAEDGKLRMLARLWTPRNTRVSTGARWGFTGASETGYVYLLLQGTTAYAMYDSAGVTAFAPAGAWNWSFCEHPTAAGHAKAEWKRLDGSAPLCDIAQHPGGDDDEYDPVELTSYGWMACVNGCCRFYGSPPPDGEEEEEEEQGGRPGHHPPRPPRPPRPTR